MLLMQPNFKHAEEAIHFASTHQMGFELMDLAYPTNLDDIEKLSHLQKAYAGAPFYSIHGVFIDLNYSGGDRLIFAESSKRIRQCIEASLFFHSPRIVIHSCFCPNLLPDNPLYGIWTKTAAEMFCSLLDEFPVTIYIENALDISPEIILNLVKCANHPRLRVCFDVAHAHLTKTPIKDWVSTLAPYITYCHLSDNHGLYDEHLPLGEGNIDWKEYNSLLGQFHIEADYTLELNTIEKLEKSFTFFREGGLPFVHE